MQANACTFLSSGDTEAAAAKKLVDRYKPLSIDEAQQVVDDAQAADGLCPK